MLGFKKDSIVPYTVLLSGFYTFVLIFCYRMELNVLIFTNVFTAAVSYAWIIASMKMRFGDTITKWMDVAVNLFTFYFVTFLTTFISFALSGTPINPLTLSLSLSPIFVWTYIWVDYFRKKVS
jgi:hypothetical protein